MHSFYRQANEAGVLSICPNMSDFATSILLPPLKQWVVQFDNEKCNMNAVLPSRWALYKGVYIRVYNLIYYKGVTSRENYQLILGSIRPPLVPACYGLLPCAVE